MNLREQRWQWSFLCGIPVQQMVMLVGIHQCSENTPNPALRSSSVVLCNLEVKNVLLLLLFFKGNKQIRYVPESMQGPQSLRCNPLYTDVWREMKQYGLGRKQGKYVSGRKEECQSIKTNGNHVCSWISEALEMEGRGSSGAFTVSAVDGNEEERAKQEGHNPACQGIQTSERSLPGGYLKGPVLTTLCKNCEHLQHS